MAAVGTVTIATKDVRTESAKYKRYTLTWLCSAGGAVSGAPFDVVAGHLVQIRFKPNGGGTQPSDQYDLTLVDTDSFDVALAQGANLSNANTSVYNYTPPGLFQDGSRQLDLVIAAAGNAKGGTVEFLIRTK